MKKTKKRRRAVYSQVSPIVTFPSKQAETSKKTILEGIRADVFMDRYALKDEQGKSLETYPEQLWERVAKGIAGVEKTKKLRETWAREFYYSLEDFKFVPAGRILSGAGTGYEVTFYNCFVLPSPPDSRGGIIDNLKAMVETMSRSGGVGINLSSLRPRGARVKKVNGTSSGPVNWAELYSVATHDVIQQGGSRRGALMLMLNDWHPDVEEFIQVKKDLSRINGANLSVCTSDPFMEAVKNDSDWDLVFPDISDPDYDKEWDGYLPGWLAKNKKIRVYKTIKARGLWDKITQASWASAEPGLVFIDRYNKMSNTWYYENIISVNPCGEQGLPALGVCNLGAINLAAFVKEDGEFDYKDLDKNVRTAIRFLDNVIEANYYFFPENEKQQRYGTRRTGLGTMGLADCLIKMKVRYGSEESLKIIEKIYMSIRDAAYSESAELAAEKGSFGAYNKEKYLEGQFIKQLPKEIRDKIAKNGIRNAVLLTQAPTGTTSLLSGVSSGIEPVYDFAFIRRDRTGEHTIYHSLYQYWREEHPNESLPPYFVSANDLTPEDHVRVQAAVQKYTDSSISKTVNAPNTHSVEDVKKLYTLAYELGCKGITYMRDGSREGVLNHIEEEKVDIATAMNGEVKTSVSEETATNVEEAEKTTTLRHRPYSLQGKTYKVKTPIGTAWVTVTTDEASNPFEVFILVGKAGSDVMADAEAIGRLISLAFRIPSNYSQKDVARQIIYQLNGIGGSASMGFGNGRVRSLADAVAKVLAETIGVKVNEKETNSSEVKLETAPTKHEAKVRDFCPNCGVVSLVFQEGCKTCYSCGYSEC